LCGCRRHRPRRPAAHRPARPRQRVLRSQERPSMSSHLPPREPAHLLVLRSIVYTGAVLAAVWPLTDWSATLGAWLAPVCCVLAAVAGLWLGRRLAVSAVRTAPVLLGCALAVLLGASAGSLLGGTPALARAVGVRGLLLTCDALASALIVASAVV